MVDVAVVVVLTGFFVLTAGYVWLCDRVVGPGGPSVSADDALHLRREDVAR